MVPQAMIAVLYRGIDSITPPEGPSLLLAAWLDKSVTGDREVDRSPRGVGLVGRLDELDCALAVFARLARRHALQDPVRIVLPHASERRDHIRLGQRNLVEFGIAEKARRNRAQALATQVEVAVTTMQRDAVI